MARRTLATRSRDRAWGATVLSGTRVPVETLFDYREASETLEEFLEQFPTVTRDQALLLLDAAKRSAIGEPVPG